MITCNTYVRNPCSHNHNGVLQPPVDNNAAHNTRPLLRAERKPLPVGKTELRGGNSRVRNLSKAQPLF